jgi:hypothetical protein
LSTESWKAPWAAKPASGISIFGGEPDQLPRSKLVHEVSSIEPGVVFIDENGGGPGVRLRKL